MTKYERVRQILGDLHYQTPTEVTTMSACANACGNGARGGGVCAECLVDELAAHVGESMATDYLVALRRYKALHEAILTTTQQKQPC